MHFRLHQSFPNINNLHLKSTCPTSPRKMVCNSFDKLINDVYQFPLSGLQFCSFAGKISTWWYSFLNIFVHNCQTFYNFLQLKKIKSVVFPIFKEHHVSSCIHISNKTDWCWLQNAEEHTSITSTVRPHAT